MLKRELKINLKSFIIWLLVLIGVFMIAYVMYPFIMSEDTVGMLDSMLAQMPPEMVKAFNFDISSMDTVYGWLKSEGFIFALLIISCYGSILGSNILLKEESDKTIEYLHSLPITRKQIVNNKVIAGVIYIFALVLAFMLFNFIGLTLSGDFDLLQFILISLTPLFPALVLYFISMYLSTYTHKTKKMIGVSLGLVLVSYFLNTLSQMSENVEFLKYFSIFTLADLRNVITNIELNPVLIIISLVISVCFYILTLIRYEKKELI